MSAVGLGLVLFWCIAFLLVLSSSAHAQAPDTPVRFLASGETTCCLNEAEFTQVYKWFEQETRAYTETNHVANRSPRVLVIHADAGLHPFAEGSNTEPVIVNRLSNDSHKPPLYIIWIFGARNGKEYVESLETVWKDAYEVDEKQARQFAQKVFDRTNAMFVEVPGKGK